MYAYSSTYGYCSLEKFECVLTYMQQLQAVNKKLENNTHSTCVTWLSSSGGAAATLLCLAKQLFHKHDEVEQLLWCANEYYEESISEMTLIIKYARVSGVAAATRELMSNRSKVRLVHSANTQLSFHPPPPKINWEQWHWIDFWRVVARAGRQGGYLLRRLNIRPVSKQKPKQAVHNTT